LIDDQRIVLEIFGVSIIVSRSLAGAVRAST
jgi:hypothetical protein